MDKIQKEKIEFADNYLFPAIEDFEKTGKTDLKHPETGESFIVKSIKEIGVTTVSTKSLGVLIRLKYKPIPVDDGNQQLASE